MSRADVIVDVGKSGIRASYDNDVQTVTGDSPTGISPASAGDQGTVLAAAVLALLRHMGVGAVTNFVIGSTAELSENERRKLSTELQEVFPTATVGIMDDGTLAHALHLDMAGVLVSVGTGVIAISRDNDGGLRRRDGWGPLLGDRGGAVSVGLAALRTSLTDVDDDTDSALRRAVESILGKLDVHKARDTTARTDWPVAVAELAPLVCELAAQGDTRSNQILDEAAEDLLRTIRRSAELAEVTDVVVVGRFGLAEQMVGRLTSLLEAAGLTRRPPNPTRRIPAIDVFEGHYRQWVHLYPPTTDRTPRP